IFFGLDGVLYSMPVSDILTFVVALFLIIRTYKEFSAERKSKPVNSSEPISEAS
ncbi:MAG: MATE family efflux transporter, partial [Ruminococcus albus]|nr:MATE family efflux transporter [Ruminococcus albus]